MIKSDKQMDSIKSKLITEQVRIKKFEEKKQKLQNVKFAKAVYDSIIYSLKIISLERRLSTRRRQLRALRNGRNVRVCLMFRY
jgi:hypothetical protein